MTSGALFPQKKNQRPTKRPHQHPDQTIQIKDQIGPHSRMSWNKYASAQEGRQYTGKKSKRRRDGHGLENSIIIMDILT